MRSAIEGHTHEQIATALGSTPGAVRQLIYRGRLAVRNGVGLAIPLPLVARSPTPAREAPAAQRPAGGAVAAGGGASLDQGAGVAAVGTIAIGSGVAIKRSATRGGAERDRAAPAGPRRANGGGAGATRRPEGRMTSRAPARAGRAAAPARDGPRRGSTTGPLRRGSGRWTAPTLRGGIDGGSSGRARRQRSTTTARARDRRLRARTRDPGTGRRARARDPAGRDRAGPARPAPAPALGWRFVRARQRPSRPEVAVEAAEEDSSGSGGGERLGVERGSGSAEDPPGRTTTTPGRLAPARLQPREPGLRLGRSTGSSASPSSAGAGRRRDRLRQARTGSASGAGSGSGSSGRQLRPAGGGSPRP